MTCITINTYPGNRNTVVLLSRFCRELSQIVPVNPRAGSGPRPSRWRTIAGLDELSRACWCWNGSRSPRGRNSGAGLPRLALSLDAAFIPHRLGRWLGGEKRCSRGFYSYNKNSETTQRCSPSAIITYNSVSCTELAPGRTGRTRADANGRARGRARAQNPNLSRLPK